MPHNRMPKPGAKYYLPKYTYKTVTNFCLQYQELKDELRALDGWHSGRNDGMPRGSNTSDPTYSDAVRRVEIAKKIKLIEDTVKECSGYMYPMMIKGVTEETVTYAVLRDLYGLPLSHREYSLLRRKIYYKLSKRI